MTNNLQPQADPAAVEETLKQVIQERNETIRELEQRIPDWIDAEIQPPVVGQDVAFVAMAESKILDGRVFGGRYRGCIDGFHYFSMPGSSFPGRYWYPLLPAPEIENNTLNSK